MAGEQIPGGFGAMPFLGETLEMLNEPYQFAKKRFERYGPVFKTRFFGVKSVVLLGAEANKYVFVTNPENFSNRAGYGFVVPYLGNSLIVTDGETHKRQRALMTPAFHGGALPGYLRTMNSVIDARLATWGEAGTRQFYDEVRRIAFTLSTALLLGVDVGAAYDRLNILWQAIARGVNAPLQLDLPFTPFGRGLAAKRAFDAVLLQLINERRGEDSADAIGLLLRARDEQGDALTDEQLCDQLRLLVFAGYDTTSGTLPWLLVELLTHPKLLERVRAEARAGELDADAPLTMDDIRPKPLLDATISETLRLHPQVGVMSRGVIESFPFGGYEIPAGWWVILIQPFTHRMSDYFANPETFDPDRFLPPRNEQQAHPYAWAGFGGGPHACLGEGIAKLEMKAVLTKLLRRYELQLAPGQDLRPIFIPMNRPKGTVPVRYTTRARGVATSSVAPRQASETNR